MTSTLAARVNGFVARPTLDQLQVLRSQVPERAYRWLRSMVPEAAQRGL